MFRSLFAHNLAARAPACENGFQPLLVDLIPRPTSQPQRGDFLKGTIGCGNRTWCVVENGRIMPLHCSREGLEDAAQIGLYAEQGLIGERSPLSLQI